MRLYSWINLRRDDKEQFEYYKSKFGVDSTLYTFSKHSHLNPDPNADLDLFWIKDKADSSSERTILDPEH